MSEGALAFAALAVGLVAGGLIVTIWFVVALARSFK